MLSIWLVCNRFSFIRYLGSCLMTGLFAGVCDSQSHTLNFLASGFSFIHISAATRDRRKSLKVLHFQTQSNFYLFKSPLRWETVLHYIYISLAYWLHIVHCCTLSHCFGNKNTTIQKERSSSSIVTLVPKQWTWIQKINKWLLG